MEDENRGPKILGVLWALTSLTTLVVLARMYIRIRMLKNFGSDDWLIALSMVRMLLHDRVSCVLCRTDKSSVWDWPTAVSPQLTSSWDMEGMLSS